MSKKILGQELITEAELLDKVNKEVKSDRPPLTKKMLFYLRDVLGIIPKAIRARDSKTGVAKAYYTPEAAHSTIVTLQENWVEDKPLKEIIAEKNDQIQEAHQKSDLFRQKYDVYTRIKKQFEAIQNAEDFTAQSKRDALREKVNKDLKHNLKYALDLLKSGGDEKLLDEAFDHIQLGYQKRLELRMADKVKRGEKE
jgi:hypothetical protein